MKASDSKKQKQASAQHSSQPFVGSKSTGAFFSNARSDSACFFQKSSPAIQPKLTVGAAGDKYEQEADRVAAQVVAQINAPSSQEVGAQQPVQRMGEEEEDLQMKPMVQRVGAEGGAVSSDFENQLNEARGGGQSLAPDLQTQMGQAMGADFSGVRVHTDNRANHLNQSIQAKAFTTGQDVFFRQGEYQPLRRSGQKLIAHELTHVVQQDNCVNLRMKPLTQLNPINKMALPVIQRNITSESLTLYDAGATAPMFEYWVNSMWKEVTDMDIRGQALSLLQGQEDSPRAGSNIPDDQKRIIMELLYNHAYQEAVWVDAASLLQEGALAQNINAPMGRGSHDTRTQTIAVGFHATARDKKTVLETHLGTIPTIERNGAQTSQDYLRSVGIEEWHPFWFGGDIENRPFLFRNVQADNELDTTVSVAKAAIDSLDFPLLNIDPNTQFNADGFAIDETYLYVVGVEQGFNTSSLQENVFGQGEIATKRLNPDQHFAYIRYRRTHAGTSRNDGYKYERIGKELLPGARKRRVTEQVNRIMSSMPDNGYRHGATAEKLNPDTYNNALRDLGIEKGQRPGMKRTWSDDQWTSYSLLLNHDYITTAPSDSARQSRKAAFLEGVRSVLQIS